MNPPAPTLSGKNRRLWHEWQTIEERLAHRTDIRYRVAARNAAGMPVGYLIDYHIRSICGTEHLDRLNEPGVANPPLFADHFLLRIDLPPGYPCIDAPPQLRFLSADEVGHPLPLPFHPNIRYFGALAGRVCLNATDTFTPLAWGIERIALYLHYARYHALPTPPYPEDRQVAAWVLQQGEPNQWIYFSSNY